MSPLAVAVVVPAYQEERLLERTLRTVPSHVHQIYVIDDGSRDGTYRVARDVARDDPRVTPTRLGFNRGVGRAIMEGYLRARSDGYDVAVVMAGDAQMDPRDLPALVKPIADGLADYVKGDRSAHAEFSAMPFVRRVGSQTLARATAIAAGLPRLADAQCGYTALRLATLDLVPITKVYPRYGYPNDLILRLASVGARIAEVPVRPVYGDEVSGFAPHQVVIPITTILVRGMAARAGLLPDQ